MSSAKTAVLTTSRLIFFFFFLVFGFFTFFCFTAGNMSLLRGAGQKFPKGEQLEAGFLSVILPLLFYPEFLSLGPAPARLAFRTLSSLSRCPVSVFGGWGCSVTPALLLCA